MSFYQAPRYVLRKRNIFNFLSDIEYKSYLDIGCGAGELACSLAQPGKKGTGTDFSKEAIEVANSLKKSRLIPDSQLIFKLGDGTSKVGTNADLVICCEVLEHVEDDHALLRKLIKKTNRYLLISVPAKQKYFDESDLAVGHFRRYEKDQLVNLLESENLEIIKFINYGYPFTLGIRYARKVLFKNKLKKNKNEELEERSKDSGINPVKPPKILTKINTEKVILPAYQLSRLFNNTNLGEGYLVLCKKSS